jgi:GT2 family glycosyltransferase
MASAANALAARAGGEPDDILAFVHQDARLLFDATVALPRYFAALPDAGVLAFAVRPPGARPPVAPVPALFRVARARARASRAARLRAASCGRRRIAHADVQTLDGYALFVRRETFDRIGGFDEGYDGWHGYDLELCTRALAAGLRNYAIGEPSRHDSWGKAGEPLARALERHRSKWSAFLAERNRRPPLRIHVYAIAKNEAAFAARFAASCAARMASTSSTPEARRHGRDPARPRRARRGRRGFSRGASISRGT